MGFIVLLCEDILKIGYFRSPAKELTGDCSAFSNTWFLTILFVFNQKWLEYTLTVFRKRKLREYQDGNKALA